MMQRQASRRARACLVPTLESGRLDWVGRFFRVSATRSRNSTVAGSSLGSPWGMASWARRNPAPSSVFDCSHMLAWLGDRAEARCTLKNEVQCATAEDAAKERNEKAASHCHGRRWRLLCLQGRNTHRKRAKSPQSGKAPWSTLLLHLVEHISVAIVFHCMNHHTLGSSNCGGTASSNPFSSMPPSKWSLAIRAWPSSRATLSIDPPPERVHERRDEVHTT